MRPTPPGPIITRSFLLSAESSVALFNSSCVNGTGTTGAIADAGLTVPKFEKIIVVEPAGVAVTVIFADEPSLAPRVSTTPPAKSAHCAAVTQLTVHAELAPNTNWTRTLRLIASTRAFCKPDCIDSAAVRIFVFQSKCDS